MSEYIVDGAVPNHTVRVEDEREVYWHMTHLPVREEIVRCRDCKHAMPDTSGRKCYEGYLWCDELTEGIGFSVAPSDFCAWGERRDA